MAWLTIAMIWLTAATARAQGYGGQVPMVPACQDDTLYSSDLGAVSSDECRLATFTGTTADACGRTCHDDLDCWCATHDRGTCTLLGKDCCQADLLRPHRDSVSDQSRMFRYVRGGASGTARTTRYWDCCKPSCSYEGRAPVTAPPRTCLVDGVTTADVSERSSCQGGRAYACTNTQPWVSRMDPLVSFGYVAFAAVGGELRTCCMCLEISFKDPRLEGKRLIAQVTNANGDDTPADDGTHIDIAVPGGGIGTYNGCRAQWNAGPSWGQQYGGLGSDRVECEGLPKQLRRGCRWQYDWLLDVRSEVDYREIECPPVLIKRSGCRRLASAS